ncbi:FKBP-type peptidyl-prolyl cis-trans isomerase [Aspergillus ruber CBS 135680]|uniref:peptidylprolyl isomerase n=1 Tax=Aspergillus ruber (strain CBS 135680) TaxID=1388766 RepID=A0A017S319_ASPRC|nr:putative FKBP-type peptidyl-prolyl isomerase [Aspergillus ruber CBS 135680]EYE91428.1 putative FKBP-type peptidyl-prolyl isomerase [Aspergillus ruber CBS 135680]
MGVTKKTLQPGNGTDYPQKGSMCAIDYTGALYDASKDNNHFMGKEFDSSRSRGPLKVNIGIGRVIEGWDQGVLQMSLGEKAILTISSDSAYGPRGFPGLIPAHSDLVFECHLVSVDGKSI